MKHEKYAITGMSCSACSSRVEKAVSKLAGMKKASVNLLTNSMQVEYDEGTLSSQDIIQAVIDAGYGATLSGGNKKTAAAPEPSPSDLAKKDMAAMKKRLIGSILFLIPVMYIAMHHMLLEWFGIPVPESFQAIFHGDENAITFAFTQFLLILPIMYLNRKYYINGFRTLFQGAPNMDTLVGMGSMAAAVYGVFAIFRMSWGMGHGDWALVSQYSTNLYFESAGMIVTLIDIGKYLEARAKGKTSTAIEKLMDLAPKQATVLRNGKEEIIPVEQLAVGDEMVIRPGESIPADGIISEGSTSIDEAAITGESIPVEKQKGDSVTSATINKTGFIHVRASRVGADTTISQIIKLVDEASASKAPIAKMADKISGIFVPVVMTIAVITGLVWYFLLGATAEFAFSTAISVLVISCPCALVISIPLTFFSGIGAASRKGILVKGSNYLEALTQLGTVVFDKTGTLTKGVFRVTAIDSTDNFSKDTVLHLAALAESQSRHPIAQSIRQAWKNPIDTTTLSDYQELSGLGICVVYRGKEILAGNETLLHQKHITFTPSPAAGTKVYIAYGGSYAGCLHITDEIKEDSRQAIQGLKDAGVSQTVMLTGDAEDIGRTVSQKLGLDTYYAQLLPQDKVDRLEELDAHKQIGKKLAFVGDGINDAPVLARADVGIAMGGLGSDAAIEAADVVLMTDEPSKLVTAIRVARATKGIAWQNIVLALGIKGLLLILGALGMATMWEAVFGDVGVMILAVLNSMRALRA